VIIGVRVKFIRGTSDDGWWKFKNKEFQHGMIEIQYKTRSYEPGEWMLECWFVDRKLSEQKG
jgi:hypothetical protein